MSKRTYVVRAWEVQGQDGTVTVTETADKTQVVVRCRESSVHLTKEQWHTLVDLRYEISVEDIEEQAIRVLASEAIPLGEEARA